MKPNILYVICHDLGRHLACYGNPTIPSPNLDALGEQGVRFTHLYAASTPCSPARGCLMTGRYAHGQGLIGLAHGASERFQGGHVHEVIVELERAFVLVTGIPDGSSLAVVAAGDADIGTLGYEMAVLADQIGSYLTPELRTELQFALPR